MTGERSGIIWERCGRPGDVWQYLGEVWHDLGIQTCLRSWHEMASCVTSHIGEVMDQQILSLGQMKSIEMSAVDQSRVP